MKLPGIAVATLAITALVGGTAVAQVTMQPIPNPPEKAKSMHHKKGKKGHHVHHHKHMHVHHHVHHTAAKKEAAPATAPAATPPQ